MFTTLDSLYYFYHLFTDREAESQRGQAPSPGSYNQGGAEAELEPTRGSQSPAS